MKIASYQNYKPSDSAWLSIIPDNWQQIRGRFVMSVNPAAVRLRSLDETDEVSFVPMEAVGENGGLNLDRTKPLDEIGSGYTEFENGDVIIAKITPCFENGKSAIASCLKNGVAFGTTELHVLRAGKRLDKQFLFYLTTSHTFRMLGESEMYGAGGQKRVPPEFAKDFRIPLPPIEEQQAIVRFLDTQTARIDTLLAKKKQLIEKLKEKRSALIARAVTRGLPPDAAQAAGLEPHPAMKNSDVEWLDKMPTHWRAAALRWMSKRYSGGTPDKGNDAYWEEGEIPWLNSGAVNDGYITEPSALITQDGFANSSAKWIPKGALVMALAGQGKTKGMVAQLGFQTTCNQSMAAIIPDHSLEPRYLFWWLSANYQNIRNMAGGDARDGLNLDLLGSIQCPLPTDIEQHAIVVYLDHETARIAQLTAKVGAVLSRLTEYRQALITSAVTGKIDVRSLVPIGDEVKMEAML